LRSARTDHAACQATRDRAITQRWGEAPPGPFADEGVDPQPR
jgi:hypothetical protein